MTTPTDKSSELLSLAERCEKATGPDKRLDVQIFILLDPDAEHIIGHEPGPFPRKAIHGPRSSFWEWATDESIEPPTFGDMLPFTASLDAAMTLIPKGLDARCSFKVESFCLGNDTWESRACVWDGLGSVSSLDTASRAASAPLALCAAALRARASSEVPHDTK